MNHVYTTRRQKLRTVRTIKTDDVLRKEIESKLGADPVLLTESVEVADSTEGDDEEEDDCDELTGCHRNYLSQLSSKLRQVSTTTC